MSETLGVQALESIKNYNMILPEDSIVAGLSGGADSVALLHWLCSLREEYNLGLVAAHVNHGLRGEESDEDEQFCCALCAGLGVPLHICRVDLSGLTSGIEESARGVRYAFFAEFERKIALAHTLSDRMETFLMNAGRGSALRGLCSIPPVRGQIVRPLIECTRAQVEEYCAANNLSYRTDSTNTDTTYRRNLIRHEVMPRLAWEPEPLRRLFRSLETDEGYLSNEAEQFDGNIKDAPEAIKGRILRAMLEQQGREPSQARMKELEKQLKAPFAGGGGGRRPGGVTQKNLHIEQFDENFIKNLPKTPKQGLANCLDCDTIIGELLAGPRAAGDRMRLCNGAGTKSFKKLCQERGVPPALRDQLLVARDDLGPVWIESFGCAHRCRITENTERAMRISAAED